MGVWVGVGARHETVNEQGISHLLEHMAFKGTEAAQRQGHRRADRGGRRRAQCRHQPGDHRLFRARCSRAMSASRSISWPTSCRSRATPQEELEREREVILQEIAATRDSPDEIAYELLQEAAFPDQPIGRPILGTTKSVKGFQPADLRAFLKANYGAKRMVLSAAGKVDHAELVRHAEALFGGMNGGAGGPIRAGALRRWHAHLGQAVRAEPLCSWRSRGRRTGSRSYYTAQVFSWLFGGGMSSRLFQEVRERRGLCYSIYSSYWALADTGAVRHPCGDGAGDDGEADRRRGRSELRRAAAEKPAEAEVARAKAQIKAGMLMGLESSSARAEQMARQLLLFDRLIETDGDRRAHRGRDA